MIASFIAMMAPAPLSPHFAAGGLLEGLNEDVTMILGMVCFLAAVDVLFVKRCIRPRARYFALHAVANVVVMIAAFPDVVRGFSGAVNCFSGPSCTMLANSANAAIHIYHCLAFKPTRQEMFHHVLFAGLMCPMAVPFKHVGGIATNFGAFFLTGAPGFIECLLLILVEHEVITRATEKSWSSWLYTWIRGPSMTVCAFLGWQSWITGTQGQFHWMSLTVCVGLLFFNGQFYARQRIESCTRYTLLHADETIRGHRARP